MNTHNANPITYETAASLSAATIDDLTLSFTVMDPLAFARHLHTLEIADEIKSSLLAAKVAQKPKERDDAMEVAIESAFQALWARLAADAVGLGCM